MIPRAGFAGHAGQRWRRHNLYAPSAGRRTAMAFLAMRDAEAVSLDFYRERGGQ